MANFQGTVGYMASSGAPLPTLSAIVAIVLEIFGALALILGIATRPLALLFWIKTALHPTPRHRRPMLNQGDQPPLSEGPQQVCIPPIGAPYPLTPPDNLSIRQC